MKLQLSHSLLIGIAFMSAIGCKKAEDVIDTITVTDIEGHVYQALQIGDQVWMAENLRTQKLNDGTGIALIEEDTAWSHTSLGNMPAYCWYLNDAISYGETYGALYNWYTVETAKLCPEGWHVPSHAEWTKLTAYLGGEKISGGQLKETGIVHWLAPNTSATNETGFTALPGGIREPDGNYLFLGQKGTWWSTDWISNENNSFGIIRGMEYQHGETIWNGMLMYMGASVRCLKD